MTVSLDSADGRAKVVRYTDRGWDFARSGEASLRHIEDAVAGSIGRERLDDLLGLLVEVAALLETSRAEPGPARA